VESAGVGRFRKFIHFFSFYKRIIVRCLLDCRVRKNLLADKTYTYGKMVTVTSYRSIDRNLQGITTLIAPRKRVIPREMQSCDIRNHGQAISRRYQRDYRFLSFFYVVSRC